MQVQVMSHVAPRACSHVRHEFCHLIPPGWGWGALVQIEVADPKDIIQFEKRVSKDRNPTKMKGQ